MPLFRSEVSGAHGKRLHGTVIIHQAPSAMLMTGISVGITVLSLTFLGTRSFSHKENVLGWIVPEAGLVQIHSPKAGVVLSVAVKLGDRVAAGQPLAVISTDLSGPNGALGPQQEAFTRQRLAALDAQIRSLRPRNDLDRARLAAKAASLRVEADRLTSERSLVEHQRDIARRGLSDIQPLLAKGFASSVERDRRALQILTAEQSISEITGQIESRKNEASDADTQLKSLSEAQSIEISQLMAQRSSIEQNLAELSAGSEVLLRSSIAGRVAAMNTRQGAMASVAAPLLAVAPSAGPLIAEVIAPTRAAGFIAVGQKVRLRIDSFPSEQFGDLEGEIQAVSRAPITTAEVGIPLDVKDAAYRIEVRLPVDYVMAYGKRQPLQPGMTLKASIVTARRTLLQWLFDPIFAAARSAAG